MRVEFSVPVPPSVNRYWRAIRSQRGGARTIVSADGRKYKAAISQMIRGMRLDKLRGDVAVEFEFHPPDRRRRDLGNIEKVLMDTITEAGVWDDDSQIVHQECWKREPIEGGLIKFRAWEISG